MTDIKDKMVQCPECSFSVPKGDYLAQKEHMEKCHPDVIIKRLRKVGMLEEADRFAREMADRYK